MRFIVTGANRGIGLEFVRQYLARGDQVVAAARTPSSSAALCDLARAHPSALVTRPCDVTDDASVRDLASALGEGAVDVLVNNAGVMGRMLSLDEVDLADVTRTFEINAVGPLRVTRALLPHLRRSSVRKVAHISSGMGSIGDNNSGGAYAYRMSKAALNMAARSMALDLKREKIIAAVFNPGWVQTDMGGMGAPTRVEDSVGRLVALIDKLTLEQSGTFLDYRGPVWPW